MTRIASGSLLVLACLVLTTSALAQVPVTLTGEGGEVNILADRIDQVDSLMTAVGNVEITKGTSRLTADRVELNRETGEAVALGKAIFFDAGDQLLGDRIDYNLKTGTGVVYNGSGLAAPYYRLSGERMDRVGEGVYNIRRGVFTTCEDDPPLWSFKVDRATADFDDFLIGRDASFWIKNFPLVPWVPFFAAALRRERQSGFLFPTFGNSSQKGVFAKIPYYWAISDSQDATLSLDTFARRGVGGDAVYRYVLSQDNKGVMQGFFIRESFKDNEDRGNFMWKHTWQITPRLSFKADVNVVSDDDFFRNYADSLYERSLQRAESKLFVAYRGESWNVVANGLWYQDLTTRRPVELQRVPEIRFQSIRQPIPGARFLLFETEASFTNFVREVGSEGRRIDFHPRIFLPIPVGGYFAVTPFVGGRATYYDTRVIGSRLTRDGQIPVEETKADSFVRALVEAGMDVEARATRTYDLEGAGGISRLQHSIEPRLNITEIRGVNQKGIPQFDPGGFLVNPLAAPLADLGIDHMPRISRLTFSLINRLNAKSVAAPGEEPVRWELMRLSLGETYDLPPNKGSERFGDLTGELVFHPQEHFQFRSDARYDVYGRGFQTANGDISATFWDVTAIAGTRFNDRASIEFVKGAVQAKLSRYLEVRGSTNWDVRTGTLVESRVGVDIHCQCASLSITYINRGGKGAAASEDEVQFSVNLLGVGEVGSRPGLGSPP